MSGFAHPLTFTEINDEDIAKIEKFMREDAIKLAKSNIHTNKSCDVLLNHEKKTEIFGKTFASCPERFHFLPGDISCIKLLIAHVKELVSTKNGRQQFKEKKKRKKNANLPFNQPAEQASTSQQSDVNGTNNSNLQLTEELLKKVVICLKSYGLETTDWAGTLIDVDSSGIYGNVNCILCDPDDDGKPKSIRVYYYSSETRKGFWTLSNYTKHLEKAHLLVAHRLTKIKSENDSSSLFESSKRKKKSSLTDLKQDPVIESISSDEHEIQSQGEPQEENKGTLLELSVEYVDSSGNIDSQMLYAQISDQMRQMLAAAIINGEQQENMVFDLEGHSSHLFLVKTKSDGNCLFSALAHQLWKNGIGSKKHEKIVKGLRLTVVDHILDPDNFPRYAISLEERLAEKKNIDEINDLTAECKQFVRCSLSCDGQWGGLETINAVSYLYRVNVVVFNEHGTCYMIKEGDDEYKITVVIAYRAAEMHNGEYTRCHYDSVTEIDSNSIFSASEFIAKK